MKMAKQIILAMVLVLLMASSAFSQASDTDESSAAEEAKAQESTEMPSLIPKLPDYSGTLPCRSYLTGDWGGCRTDLADKGILFDIDVVQSLQGNARGGKDTNGAIAYSGSANYTLQLDTARMGLWPGGLFLARGKTFFGHSINRKVGSVMPPNFDALLPSPDDSGLTTLSEAYLTQALSENLVLVLGKLDGATVADSNEFAYNEKTQFMNLAFRANPVVLPFAPYTVLTAGVMWKPTEWLENLTAVLDTNGLATRTGFDTWPHSPEGTTFFQQWTFTIKPCGLPGHQRFAYGWSSKDYDLLDQDRRLGILPRPLQLRFLRARPVLRVARLLGLARSFGNPDTRPDDWHFFYNFDQYLYTEQEDPTQGFGMFGRFGWSDGRSNPVAQFYSIGAGGKGIVPCRDEDRFGVGYYFVKLSDDLSSILGVESEQGVEAFYNFEVFTWLQITPDLQVIVDPGGVSDNDVSFVYGLRVYMVF